MRKEILPVMFLAILAGCDAPASSPNKEKIWPLVAKSHMIATGTLSVRGVTQEIALPFTLEEREDGRTVAMANVSLDRAAYGFAEGAGLGDDIGASVEVELTIVASPAGEVETAR